MWEEERLMMVKMVDIVEPEDPVRQKMSEEGLEELAKSMGKVGLLQPIILVRKGSGWEIDKGHRRFLAAKSLGWSEIKALVRGEREEDLSLGRIHENLHKEDMSPIEEAVQLKKLIDKYGYSEKDAGKVCSKSESWVRARVGLLDMAKELQEAVDVGALSIGAARELSGITDEASRAYYLGWALKQGATAMLCAYWRGQWELTNLVHAPLGTAGQSMPLEPPPMEVEIPCQWCFKMAPISKIEHVRVCPVCLSALIETRTLLHSGRVADGDGGQGGTPPG